MKIEVEMRAYQDGVIRDVDVPDAEIAAIPNDAGAVDRLLGLVFHYGQNDFQPVRDRCSVSVGDIIRYPYGGEHAGKYRVEATGFSLLKGECGR